MTDEEKKLNEAIKQDGIETQSEILEELKRRYPQYVERSHNEQEIERMAKTIVLYAPIQHCKKIAQALVNAGIGDKKQAVKESFEKLKECSCYFAGAEYVDIRDIDNLFTELYGADE